MEIKIHVNVLTEENSIILFIKNVQSGFFN